MKVTARTLGVLIGHWSGVVGMELWDGALGWSSRCDREADAFGVLAGTALAGTALAGLRWSGLRWSGGLLTAGPALESPSRTVAPAGGDSAMTAS